eukprot:7652935-Alexandrium_andersonii.AAC.1
MEAIGYRCPQPASVHEGNRALRRATRPQRISMILPGFGHLEGNEHAEALACSSATRLELPEPPPPDGATEVPE